MPSPGLAFLSVRPPAVLTSMLLLVLVSTRGASAQKTAIDAPVRDKGSITRTIDVSITNLEVIVTDSRGERVPGLKVSDFEVREDGRVKPLTNFIELRKELPVLGETPTEGGPKPASGQEPVTEPPPSRSPSSPRTHLVVFVDNSRLSPLARNRVLRRVGELLSRLMDGAVDASVVTWDGSLRVRQPFAADAASIARTLAALEADSTSAFSLANEKREVLRQIDEAVTLGGNPRPRVQAYCAQLESLQRNMLLALRAVTGQLAGAEGRKILVCVTEGLAQTPGLDIWTYMDDVFHGNSAFLEGRQYDLTGTYRDVIRAANSAGVAFYVVDASGLSVDPSVSGEHGKTLGRLDSGLERSNQQSMMKLIAEETGGEAITDTNDVSTALTRLGDDTTSYYSIGYPSTGGAPDRERKIVVKMQRKGLKARSRRSLVERSPETRLADAVRAALFLPRDENPLELILEVGNAKEIPGGTLSVPIRISGPMSRIVLAGVSTDARLSVHVAALSDRGDESEISSRSLAVSKEPGGDAYHCEVALRFRPGRYTLSIAVKSEVGSVSYLQTTVTL